MIKNFVFLLLFCGGLILSHADEGINITDVLNVRDSPSISGNVIQQSKFGEIFSIYDEKGTGTMINGIQDLWYKISRTEEKWVNGYYMRKFPFYIASDTFSHIYDRYSEYRLDRNTVQVKITGYEVQNEITLLTMDIIYVEDDVENVLGEYSYDDAYDAFMEPKKYSRIQPVQEDYTFFGKKVPLMDSTFTNLVQTFDWDKVVKLPRTDAYMWNGREDHYDAFMFDLSSIELQFGIKTGMVFSAVQEIIGKPQNTYEYDDKIEYMYSNILPDNSIIKLYFYTAKSNRIEQITLTYSFIR